jgi:hypothetical protein
MLLVSLSGCPSEHIVLRKADRPPPLIAARAKRADARAGV